MEYKLDSIKFKYKLDPTDPLILSVLSFLLAVQLAIIYFHSCRRSLEICSLELPLSSFPDFTNKGFPFPSSGGSGFNYRIGGLGEKD